MRSLCEKELIPQVRTFETFKQKVELGEKVLIDGIHPNNAGHSLIYSLVLPELDKLAGINTS